MSNLYLSVQLSLALHRFQCAAKTILENSMRRHPGLASLIIMAVSLLICYGASAQALNPAYGSWLNNQGTITGGIGLSTIDGQSYFTINFRPELASGKFGMGLDVMLRFDSETGDLRAQDWDQSYDWFRVLRYVRYGFKQNPD